MMKNTNDDRLVLLMALIRHADQCGDEKPHFYKDEMLKRLDVCDHVFNIMLGQLGSRYCSLVDNIDGAGKYEINLSRCLALRDQLIREKVKKTRQQKIIRNSVFVASIGILLLILVCCI